jgi:hypothetical protein
MDSDRLKGGVDECGHPDIHRFVLEKGLIEDDEIGEVFKKWLKFINVSISKEDVAEIISIYLQYPSVNLNEQWESGIKRRDGSEITVNPLMIAIDRRMPQLVEVLLDRGADADGPTYAVYKVIVMHQLDTLRVMLPYIQKSLYSGLITQCIENGFDEGIQVLLDAGADINGSGEFMTSVALDDEDEFKTEAKDDDILDTGFQWSNRTPLNRAIDLRNERYVDILLKLGADPVASKIYGNDSSLGRDRSVVYFSFCLGVHIPIVKVLAQHRIDWSRIRPNNPFANTSYTLLYHAISSEEAHTIVPIILSGGKHDLFDPSERTMARLFWRNDLLEYLLQERLIDPNARFGNMSLLSYAASENLTATDTLIRHGAIDLTKEAGRRMRSII